MSSKFREDPPLDINQYLNEVKAGRAGEDARAQTLARSSGNPRAQAQGIRMMGQRADQNQANRDDFASQQEAQAKVQAKAAEDAVKDQAKQAEDLRKRNVRAGAAAGMKTSTDIETGKRSIQTHPDGAPVFEAGPTGPAQEVGTSRSVFRTPDGKTTAPGASGIMLGGGGSDGAIGAGFGESRSVFRQPIRDDRGEVTFQEPDATTQASTGLQTVTETDPTTGRSKKRAVGVDEAAYAKAQKDKEFEMRGNQIALRKNAVDTARFRFDPQFKPVDDEFKASQKEMEALPPVFVGNNGVWKYTDPKTLKVVSTYDLAEVERNKNLRTRAEARNARAKEAYDRMAPTSENFARNDREIEEEKRKLEGEKIRFDNGLPEDDGGASKILDRAQAGETVYQKELDDANLKAIGIDPGLWSMDKDGIATAEQFPPDQRAINAASNTQETATAEEITGPGKPLINPDTDEQAVRSAYGALRGLENVSVQQDGASTTLWKDGRLIASIRDGGGSPIIVLLDGARTDADIQKIVAMGETSGAPLYIRKSDKRKSLTEEATGVAEVFQTIKDPSLYSPDGKPLPALSDRLEALGATPAQIMRSVDAGELSVQHGQAMLKDLYGMSMEASDPTDPKVFEKWVADTTRRENKDLQELYDKPNLIKTDSTGARMEEATTGIKDFGTQDAIKKDFLVDQFQQNHGKPDQTFSKYVQLHRGVNSKTGAGAADIVGSWAGFAGKTITNDVLGSMLGLATGMAVQGGAGIMSLLGDEEAGKTNAEMTELRNRSFANFTQGVSRNAAKWGTSEGRKNMRTFDQSFQAFGDIITAEMDKPIGERDQSRIQGAKNALMNSALALHELSQDEDWPVTADNLNPDKDPALQVALARFAATADPRELEAMRSRLLLDNGGRQLAGKLEKKIRSDGFWGAVEGGTYAGWQEIGTELLADAAILVTAGGSKIVQGALKTAGAVGKAKRIERAGARIGSAIDKFNEFGIKKATLSQGLSTADKSVNTAKGIAKTVVVGGGGEGLEEVIVEAGESDPNLAYAFGVGMLGGVALTPVFYPVQRGIQAGQERQKAATLIKQNTDYARNYNAANQGTPGHVDLTPETAATARTFINSSAFTAREKAIGNIQAMLADTGVTGVGDSTRARLEASLQPLIAEQAIADEGAIEAAREIAAMPEEQQRVFHAGIAKVATGNASTLTSAERNAITGASTASGNAYFAEVNGKEYLTDEARAEVLSTSPALGSLIQTTESQAIYEQAQAAANFEDAPSSQTPSQPAPDGSQGDPAAGGVVTPHETKGGLGTPSTAAQMDAGIYESQRAANPGLAQIGDVVAQAFASGQPVSASMVNATDIEIPDGYQKSKGMWVNPSQGTQSGTGSGQSLAPQDVAGDIPAKLTGRALMVEKILLAKGIDPETARAIAPGVAEEHKGVANTEQFREVVVSSLREAGLTFPEDQSFYNEQAGRYKDEEGYSADEQAAESVRLNDELRQQIVGKNKEFSAKYAPAQAQPPKKTAIKRSVPRSPNDKQISAPTSESRGDVVFERPDGSRYTTQDIRKTDDAWTKLDGATASIPGYQSSNENGGFTLTEIPYSAKHEAAGFNPADTIYDARDHTGRSFAISATSLQNQGAVVTKQPKAKKESSTEETSKPEGNPEPITTPERKIAEKIKANVEKAIPGLKGRIEIVESATDTEGSFIGETGGAYADADGKIRISLSDLRRDIRASGNPEATAEAVENIVIRHEAVHVVQYEAVRRMWEEAGKPGSYADFFRTVYGKIATELSPEAMAAARAIYGEEAWDSMEKTPANQAAELVRMLVEAKIDPSKAEQFSELYRAVLTSNSPTLIDMLRKAVEMLSEMIRTGNLPESARIHVDAVEALYNELLGETGLPSQESAEVSNDTPSGFTIEPAAGGMSQVFRNGTPIGQPMTLEEAQEEMAFLQSMELSPPRVAGLAIAAAGKRHKLSPEDLRELSFATEDIQELLETIEPTERMAFIDTEIDKWAETQKEAAKEATEEAKPKTAKQRDTETAAQKRADQILNSGNFPAIDAIVRGGAGKMMPPLNWIALAMKRKRDGARLTNKELKEISSNRSYDGWIPMSSFQRSGNGMVARHVLGKLIAKQGEGMRLDVVAGYWKPDATPSDFLVQLDKELRAISTGTALEGDKADPNRERTDAEIAEEEAEANAAEFRRPSVPDTTEAIQEAAAEEFGEDSQIAQKAGVMLRYQDRFDAASTEVFNGFLLEEMEMIRQGVVSPKKWTAQSDLWSEKEASDYAKFTGLSNAQIEAWAEGLEVIEEEDPTALFSSPSPLPQFSSSNVSELRKDKTEWLTTGGGLKGALAIVDKYNKPGAYALIPADAILVPMPSTSGKNLLPHALALRISRESGQAMFESEVATAGAEKEAKAKNSYFAKMADPVFYEPTPEIAKLAALGKPVFITEDVHNTGESWQSFAKTLQENGIEVAGIATLVSTEQRKTSPRDIERLAGKVSNATSIPLDETLSLMQSLFDGTFKQLFNKAEAAASRSSADAARILEIARSRPRRETGDTQQAQPSDEQGSGGLRPQDGNSTGVDTQRFPLRSSPSQGSMDFGASGEMGDRTQRGLSFDSMPETGEKAKYQTNAQKAIDEAPNEKAREAIANRIAIREGIKNPATFIKAAIGGQAAFDFGTTGSFGTRQQAGFDFEAKASPAAAEPAKDTKPSNKLSFSVRDVKKGGVKVIPYIGSKFTQAEVDTLKAMGAEISRTASGNENGVEFWGTYPNTEAYRNLYSLLDEAKAETAFEKTQIEEQNQKDLKKSSDKDFLAKNQVLIKWWQKITGESYKAPSSYRIIQDYLNGERGFPAGLTNYAATQEMERNGYAVGGRADDVKIRDEWQTAKASPVAGDMNSDTAPAVRPEPKTPEFNLLPKEDKQEITKAKQAQADLNKSGIQDFGEKMAGARKDAETSTSRDISDEDLATLPFSKIWPKAEVDAIEDPDMAALAHALRSVIPAKPRVSYKLNRWLTQVKQAREFMRIAETAGMEKVGAAMKEKYVFLQMTAHTELLQSIPRAEWDRVSEVNSHPDAYRFDAERNRVPAPYADAKIDGLRMTGENIPALAEKLNEKLAEGKAAAPKMKFEVRQRRAGGDAWINKKGDPLRRKLKTFPDSTEALRYVRDNNTDLVAEWEKVKDSDNVKESDVRGTENRPRSAKDHRKGKDATPEMFENAFGFRGVEFGNWVSQGKNTKERQGMLNAAYDALLDLSDIVGIPPKAISLNGEMGLAFGSRGKGGASAHYEPGNIVINLTKTRGAGTLAHEWFHALDHYFSRQRGGNGKIISQEQYRDDNFITHRPEPLFVHKQHGGKGMTRSMLDLRQKQNPESGYFKEDNWMLDPKHPKGVRPEVERRFAVLVDALVSSPMASRAAKIDKGKSGGYWSRTLELAARSFENYTIGKMMQEGYHNDYLANVVDFDDFGRDDGRYPYLLAEELPPIAEAFDDLFGTIQTEETDQGVRLFSSPSQVRSYLDSNGTPSDVSKRESERVSRALAQPRPSRLAEGGATYSQDDLFGVDSTDIGQEIADAGSRAKNSAKANPTGNAVSDDLAKGLTGDWAALAREVNNKGRASTILADLINREIPVWNVNGTIIESPADVHALMIPLRSPYFESMKVMVVDGNQKIVHSQIMTVGTLNETNAHPGEIMGALARLREIHGKKYTSLIISHNHPSGDPQPSRPDLQITENLQRVAEMTGWNLIDHIITNGEKYFSFRESGGLSSNMNDPEKPYKPRKQDGKRVTLSTEDTRKAPWEAVLPSKLQLLDSPEPISEAARHLRQGDPSHAHIFYMNTKLQMLAVERVEGTALLDKRKFAQILLAARGREGAYAFAVDYPAAFAPLQEKRLSNNINEVSPRIGIRALDAVKQAQNGYESMREAGTLMEDAAQYGKKQDQPDLFAAATAPDAAQKLGGVKVGTMNALGAYRTLTAKRAKLGSISAKEEQQLLDAETALGQKMAFDMEAVKGNESSRNPLQLPAQGMKPKRAQAEIDTGDNLFGDDNSFKATKDGQMTLFSSPSNNTDGRGTFSKEERKQKFAEYNRLKEVARNIAGDGDLTAREAKRFEAINKSINELVFDIAPRPKVEKLKSEEERKSTLPFDVVTTAWDDQMRSKPIWMAIAEAANGVYFDKDTAIDEIIDGKNATVTPEAFRNAFKATREALRSAFGDDITLYRSGGLQKSKATQNWATTRESAEQFGSRVESKQIPISQIVAVNVGANGNYHEMIVEKDGQALFSSPSPSPSQSAARAALDSLPPRMVAIYDAVNAGMSPSEIMKTFGVTERGISNAMDKVRARIVTATAAARDELNPAMKDGMYDGGRPDLALGAEDNFAAVDQIRNESGIPDVRGWDEVNEEADAMLAADYQGTYDMLLKKARDGQPMTDTEVSASKRIIARETLSGAINTEQDRVKLAMMIHGYRDQGTEAARSLAIRRDPHLSPAERHAQFIAEALFSPDAATRKRMKKNPKAAETELAGWMARAQNIEQELLAQGINIQATLAAFRADQEAVREGMEDSPNTAKIIEDQTRKLSLRHKAIIEAVRSGALVGEISLLTGVSTDEVKAVYSSYLAGIKAAMAESAKRFMSSSLASSPSSMMEDILADLGLPSLESIDDTADQRQGFLGAI